jgi:acetate kinase
MLGKPLESLRLITCHLGNGASLAGIANGACRSTTMGYTPLAGLMMGTRSGSIDPGILLHLLTHGKYSASELLRVLNQESGLKGISGLSGDMREILVFAADGNSRAALAFDMYIESLRAHIGSLAALLAGVDALVFTGGVGENSYRVRQEACQPLAFMGLELDRQKNESCQPDALISTDDSSVAVLVIRAQEDVAIARHCLALKASDLV